MMNAVEPRRTLEEVLDDYVTTVEVPSHATLVEWIRRYPQFEQALVEFTAAWSGLELWAASTTEGRDAEPAQQHRDATSAQAILAQKRTERDSTNHHHEPLTGLITEAQHLGWPVDRLVEQLDLTVALVRKLDRRLIRYVTIPLQLIEGIAIVLSREAITVARYLYQPPVLSADTRHRSDTRPAVVETESFYDAVRHDRELDESLRQRWLSLEHPKS